MLNDFEIEGNKISVQIFTEYLQKQLSAKEGKQGGETIVQDSGASYIHTQSARALLMQKLIESKDITEAEKEKSKMMLGLTSRPDDDEGQAIRSQNFANKGQAQGSKPAPTAQQIKPTACVLLSNMFDPSLVDLNKDPQFFIDIKDHVYNTCSEWGRVEKIFIEEDSAGQVWIKYSGSNAVESAGNTVDILDQKTFDNRVITAQFITEEVFYQKLMDK